MPGYRYFIQLAYKGTHYFGWQVQPNQISVQEEIERALTQLNSNQRVEITGCGRTDTGVHASQYYAHFDTTKELDAAQLKYKLNLMLPQDIAILAVFRVHESLHARFSAISRTYEYHLHTAKNPFLSDTSWHYAQVIDMAKIREGCALIEKQTDFECFSKVNTDVANFNCTIQHLSFTQHGNGLILKISANRFLRNMVRAVTGTLLDLGTGKISMTDLQEIVASRDRSKAGVSVPAHGLILTKVDYPAGSF